MGLSVRTWLAFNSRHCTILTKINLKKSFYFNTSVKEMLDYIILLGVGKDLSVLT